jgi:hypothetical protein
MPNGNENAGARAFVRSLNILLKSVSLYGLGHGRSADQLKTAWDELQTQTGGEGGFVLGVAGKQLLANGSPVEAGPAERSFADLLAAAGVASIHFAANVSLEDFRRLVTAFASAKKGALAEQLKTELAGGDGTIRVNALRYVAEDAALGHARATTPAPAVMPVQTALGPGRGSPELAEWVNDPRKLLQLITAAQGAAPNAPGAPAAGTSPDAPPVSPQAGASAPVYQGDALNLLTLITKMARASRPEAGADRGAPLPQQLAELPATTQEMFRQALASLAAVAPAAPRLEAPVLVELAEHLSIRLALERFERGDVRVNAVRELLERSSREIATLRKVLTGHEEKLAQAGVTVESHTDILDRQFWSAVPESGKRAALMSPEAWCIPPRNVRQAVEQMLERGDKDSATAALLNYASCVGGSEPEARRKTAAGLLEMINLFARVDIRVLDSAIRCLGEQLTWEQDADLQDALSRTYARLTQEAAAQRNYSSVQTALSWLDHAGREKPELAAKLAPQLGVSDRLPEFIEAAMAAPQIPAGLTALLQRMAQPAAMQLAARFSKCGRRDECVRLIELFGATGAEGVLHLREVLRTGPAAEAASTVGLLSRYGSTQLERLLHSRVASWSKAHQDAVVRQLACADSPERGRLLARIFTQLDSMVLPEALDEISMCGDGSTSGLLLRLAAGEVAQSADPYLRVKAIEGLGRMREKRAIPLLRELASARQMFRWVHPDELRIVSLQALDKMDMQWTRAFLPQSGVRERDLALAPLDAASDAPWARQRRYSRVSLPRAVSAVATTSRGEVPLETTLLSLGGGMGSATASVQPGTEASLRLRSGLRTLTAGVVVREAPRQQVGFEIVEIALEDRTRLRRMLSGFSAA